MSTATINVKMGEVVDSNASRQSQFNVPLPADSHEPNATGDDNCHGNTVASKQPAFTAPTLRVEELRDELGCSADEMISGSSACATDDELGVSPGDLSDQVKCFRKRILYSFDEYRDSGPTAICLGTWKGYFILRNKDTSVFWVRTAQSEIFSYAEWI